MEIFKIFEKQDYFYEAKRFDEVEVCETVLKINMFTERRPCPALRANTK